MWIVALALRRPYTFVVMALLIIILFSVTVIRTPVDIFPEINIPVVSVIWNFTGLAPSEMADRIVANSEPGFLVFDVADRDRESALGVGHDPVRHLARRQARVVPYHADNGNIDFGENVD